MRPVASTSRMPAHVCVCVCVCVFMVLSPAVRRARERASPASCVNPSCRGREGAIHRAPWLRERRGRPPACFLPCSTAGARQMFPGREPILQWGIKKGDAQSFSVQEECTTPPRRGGRGARRGRQRRGAQRWWCQGRGRRLGLQPSTGCRTLLTSARTGSEGVPRMGRREGTGGRVGRPVPTTAPPPWDSVIATRLGCTRCRLRETRRCLNQPHAHGLKTRSYRISTRFCRNFYLRRFEVSSSSLSNRVS